MDVCCITEQFVVQQKLSSQNQATRQPNLGTHIDIFLKVTSSPSQLVNKGTQFIISVLLPTKITQATTKQTSMDRITFFNVNTSYYATVNNDIYSLKYQEQNEIR